MSANVSKHLLSFAPVAVKCLYLGQVWGRPPAGLMKLMANYIEATSFEVAFLVSVTPPIGTA